MAIGVLAGPVRGEITLVVNHRDGTGSTVSGKAPLHVNLDCGDTTSTHYYNPRVSVRHAGVQWTASASGTGEYFLEASGGGDPGVAQPDWLYLNDVRGVVGTLGSLTRFKWAYGDNDTLGFDTIYARVDDDSDPDGKAAGYIEAAYGHAARIIHHATGCTWTVSTKTIDCSGGTPSDPFRDYRFRAGDRVNIEGEDGEDWYVVDSKASNSAIVLTTNLTGAGGGSDQTDVIVYRPINPFFDLKYSMTFTGTRPYTNTDNRPGAASTAIPYLTWSYPQACPVFTESGTISITVTDPYHGESDNTSITVTVGDWSGSTDIYLSNSGDDTTGDGSSGNPFRGWKRGVETLFAADGGANGRRLLLPDGYTDTMTAAISGIAAGRTGPYHIVHNGTGTRPVIYGGVNGGSLFTTLSLNRVQDLRVEGIDFEADDGGGGSGQKGIVISTTVTTPAEKVLVLGCVIRRFDYGMQFEARFGGVIDCEFDDAGGYLIYGQIGPAPSATAEGAFRAYVGNVGVYSTGNGAALRLALNRSLFAYCDVHNDDADGATLRIAAGHQYMTSHYSSIVGNTLRMTNATAGDYVVGVNHQNAFEDLDWILFEGNYVWHSAETTGESVGVNWYGSVNTARPDHVMVRNNVFHDVRYAAGAGSSGTNGPFLEHFLHHNSFYTAKGTGVGLFKTANSTDGGQYLEVVGNIVYVPNATSGSRMVHCVGSFASTAGINVIGNLVGYNAGQFLEGPTAGATKSVPARWADDAATEKFNLVSGADAIEWIASGTGTGNYYVRATGGGAVPGLTEPVSVEIQSDGRSKRALPLANGSTWAWGDQDSLGFATIYVRLADNADPDSKADGWVQSLTYTQWNLGGEICCDTDVNPRFADVSTADFRLCTGTDQPVAGCVASPAIDSPYLTRVGFWDYRGATRDATPDIGALEVIAAGGGGGAVLLAIYFYHRRRRRRR